MSDCISGQRGLDVQDTILHKAVGSIICVPVIAHNISIWSSCMIHIKLYVPFEFPIATYVQ